MTECHSMCGSHEDSDMIFDSAKNFGRT